MKLGIFLDRFSGGKKVFGCQNFMKIRPVGAELLACRRTDMPKLIVVFPSFAKAPKIWRWDRFFSLSSSVLTMSLSLHKCFVLIIRLLVPLSGQRGKAREPFEMHILSGIWRAFKIQNCFYLFLCFVGRAS